MKKSLLHLVALALTAVLLLPVLAGCGAGSGSAIRYGDYEISQSIYQYMCCLDKTSFLYEANRTTSDKTSASQLTDLPAIWVMVDDNGNTVADNLKENVTDKLAWMLYLEQYAKDRGYTLTDEDKAGIKNDLNKLVKNFETKSEFNKVMKAYGINYDQMLDYYYHQGLASIGNYMLFGENGEMEISDSTAQAFFQKNYVTVGCIYINNQNKTYANGKTVYLPDNEKAAKNALAEELMERLKKGEDFATLYREYSDRKSSDPQSDSFTFTTGTFGVDEVEEAAFALSTGDITKIDTDSGIFILQRRGLSNAYFDGEKDTIIETLEDQRKDELLQAAWDKFSFNESFIASIDVASISHVK